MGGPSSGAGLAGLLGAWLLRLLSGRVLGREALGLGDVKLLGVAGLWLPLAAWPAYLVTAGLAGLVTGLAWRHFAAEPEFPFGPALALALFGILLVPEAIPLFS